MFMQVMTFGTELRERLTGYKPQLVESFFFFLFLFLKQFFPLLRLVQELQIILGKK